LTSIFRDHYCYIEPFNNEEAFVTDKTLETFNADKMMINFINYVHEAYMKDYRGNHVALPWGCDFAYQNALFTWRNMEKIVDYINKHNTVNMKLVISTP
jgi:lysosomal alpha-mannosidase